MKPRVFWLAECLQRSQPLISLMRSAVCIKHVRWSLIGWTRVHAINASQLTRSHPTLSTLPRVLRTCERRREHSPTRRRTGKNDGYKRGNPITLSRRPHGPCTPQYTYLSPLTCGPITCQPTCHLAPLRRVHVSTCPCKALPRVHIVPRQIRGSRAIK